MEQHFRASGKLLLSGEYFVLDGALALAVPTQQGQKMIVREGKPGLLHWRSYSAEGRLWFEGYFDLERKPYFESTDEDTARRLMQLIRGVEQQRPGFWSSFFEQGLSISTYLEFPRAWGLGSSSTLISLLAQWSDTNPYALLDGSFGGSGYDLACATASGPLFYQKKEGLPHFVEVPFLPPFSEHICFVFLGKKQNSREGIARYREKVGAHDAGLNREISQITLQMAAARTLADWNASVEEHEALISKTLGLSKVKSLYFDDFPGAVKSLGAWGGDFVLATSELTFQETRQYFAGRGFETLLSCSKMLAC